MENTSSSQALPTLHGSCHCGAVRFEVDADHGGKATRCNCTICQKTMITGLMIKPERFRLLTPRAALTSYGRHDFAKRYFCSTCGVHCFGEGDLPILGGAFVSINVSTLDDVDVGQLEIGYWDGRHDNWHAGLRDRPWPVSAPPRA